MDKEEFILKKTNPGPEWDAFVEASENGTVFSLSAHINAVKAPVTLYYCMKSEEIKAAVAVVENSDGNGIVLHDFIIYNGVMFAPPKQNQNYSQIQSDQFRISEFIANELVRKYKSIELSFHPAIKDIRSFLWVNYGTEKPQYKPDVRYTCYVDISDFAKAAKLEDISIYNKASYARRQEIRYAIRDGVKTVEEFDAKKFVAFYNETMKRQDIIVETKVLEEMEELLICLFNAKIGHMYVSYTASGEPGSMSFWGIDSKRAYYIFGANDPLLRDYHTGTAVLWDAFKFLNVQGVKEVDLEGINSPRRGWFKTSFGGDIVSYYHMFLKG